MGEQTNIEWTGSTWPVVQGCDYESPGCAHCYVVPLLWRMSHNPNQTIAAPLQGLVEKRGDKLVFTGKVTLRIDRLSWPLKWREPRHIFISSHGDLFHPAVPDEFVVAVFAVMAIAHRHTFQVLTKRPDRMRKFCEWLAMPEGRAALQATMLERGSAFAAVQLPLRNVWLGTSVEDQRRANERIPELLATPAARRFLSCEPLLGLIDLEYPEDLWPNGPTMCCDGRECGCMGLPIDPPLIYGIHWIIAGGESGGRRSRPMHPDWARSLRDQCQAARVPFFFKQWGDWLPGENDLADRPAKPTQWQDGETGQHSTCRDNQGRERPDEQSPEWRHFTTPGSPGAFALRVGKKQAGAMLDGREWREFPP